MLAKYSPTTDQSKHVLGLIQRLSDAVNTSVLQDDVFDAMGAVMGDYFAFDGLTLAILAPNLQGIGRIVRIDAEGFADTQSENHRYTGTDPLLEPLLLYSEKPTFLAPAENPSSVLLPDYRCHAMVFPVFTKRQPIGILVMHRKQRFEPFTHEEQVLLQQTLPLIALALEHARLYSDMQTLVGRQMMMNHLSMSIRQSLDVTQILKTATNELGQILGVSRCHIHAFKTPIPLDNVMAELGPSAPDCDVYTYSLPHAKEYNSGPEFEHPYGFEWRLFTEHQYVANQHNAPIRQGLTPFFFFQDGKPHHDGWRAPKSFYDHNQLQSLGVVPIITKDTWVGSITLHQCNKVRVWLHEDKELLKSIGEHLGLAMSQARFVNEIHTQKNELSHTLEELQQAQMYLIQSEKMAMLGQFVAGIAHEVNTPLGAIISNTQTLQKVMEKIIPDEPVNPKFVKMANELLATNQMASERIKETVVNLRNFARLDESEQKTVDVHEGLDSTLLLMKNVFSKKLKLGKEYDKENAQLRCFPGLLNQVFMNLMVNASHAMEGMDTPTLGIRTSTFEDAHLGHCLKVSIQDNGKGIPPENISKLFDPGFTTKSRGVGTGLGLALCFRIVEKHKGRIDVVSKVDVGTRFDVLIPTA